jgi:hypothetical protein
MAELKQLVKLVEESNLPKSKAKFILENFQGYFELAETWERKAKELIVTDENQVAEMKMAREGRLFLRQKRIAIENSRKELKEQSLREGKAIDGIANVLKALIIPIEGFLEQQEKFREIKKETEKIMLREERMKKIGPYMEIIENIPFDLGEIDEKSWNTYFKGVKQEFKEYQDKLAAEEKARKEAEEAEKKRIWELELHQKRAGEFSKLSIFSDQHLGLLIEKEYQELKAKLLKLKAKAEAERKKKEAEEKAKWEKAEAERKKKEAEEKVKWEKAEAERKKKEAEIQKLKAEAEARHQAEIEAKKKAEAEARKKAEAPDIEKAKEFIAFLTKMEIPDFKTEKFQRLGHFVFNKIGEIVNQIYKHPEFKELLK